MTISRLPRIPPMRIGGGLSYERGHLLTKVSFKRVAIQDRVASYEEPTDGYVMLDASVRYRLFIRGMVHQLTFQGLNLANMHGRVHTSFLKDVVPLPGRDLRFTYQLSF